MALTPGKAKKMLSDGTVHGRNLTDKQKRYFGAIAGGATPMKKINGGWLDKYAMGGSLPGASGMMYARSNTPPPLYTQSEMKAPSFADSLAKAQTGKSEFPRREIAIDNTAVRPIKIPIIEKKPKPVIQNTQPMLSQDNRTFEQREEDRAYTEERNSPTLPPGAVPLTYLSNPFRLVGDIYNATIQPAATSIFSTSTLQPLTGDFWTSDEVARKLNSRRVQRERGQISVGEELYGNLMQGLPETGWAAATVFGGQLLNKLGSKAYNFYKNYLGDAFKIGAKSEAPYVIPTWLTRGQTPPNKLIYNPKMDANRFMQSWTNPNNPSFVSKFDDQIMKPFGNPSLSESYLKTKTRELNLLKQQLDDFNSGLGTSGPVLPKAKYLQNQINQLTDEINMIYRPMRGNLARNNMRQIQAGEFPTTYSTTGFTPGSGGTYYVPTANQPMNTWKYMYPNRPNTLGVGNNSVVKLSEVPVGSSVSEVNKARTREMLTGIHETLGHASNAGGSALTKQTTELIKGALKPNPKIAKGTSEWVTDFLGPKATYKDWAKYLSEPTEVIARVMELRRQYINPKHWGTGSQYEISDELVNRIFRDGLSGKSKVSPDFFRVIDQKGLKKLMKGLYATVPMAIGADGLLEYKHGGNLPKMKNGGWLDKYEVVEDDMGQLTNPGKITKINSNNITMKGVDFPVLGISDTGDKKMMQPGKDYKFDGNSVTEYPMAQEGETVDVSEQIDFLKNWNMSNRGQELLSNSFDGKEKLITDRTNRRNNFLDTVSVEQADGGDDYLGRYNPGRHRIRLDNSLFDGDFKFVGKGLKDVALHELSHSQDYSGGTSGAFNKLNMPLSDVKLINSLNKTNIKNLKNNKDLSKSDVSELKYIGDPTEVRARLNAIRYFYENTGLKEEGMPSIFDSEVTPEMQDIMKINDQYKDLNKLYSDDEINMLLNTISDNSQSSGPSNMAYAQEGAGVNEEGVKQYKWFKNYMQSPKYVERLKKEFPDYTNEQIGQEIKTRLENVMQTRVGFLPRSSDISTGVGGVQGVYDADEYPGSIMLRPEYSASTSDVLFEPGNYLSGYNTIPLHEWSHAADDGGNRMPQSTTDLMLSRMKENSLDIPKDQYYYTRPTEYLGRMQPLRYLMEQEGLYDAGTQDFTKEDLEKAKQNKTIKNNVHFQDLMKNVNSDEDFIELMNTVASVNQKDNSRTMMAKQGRSLVSLDQLTNFTNYNTPQPGGWLDKY